MWLKNQLMDDVNQRIDEIFYLTWEAAKKFNERRDKDDPLVFSGWYWARGREEGGPFKSKSAAYRDAWFRLVRRVAPPSLYTYDRTKKSKLKLVA